MSDTTDDMEIEAAMLDYENECFSCWTTATGKRIAFKDLEYSHLINIIKKFRNDGEEVPQKIINEFVIRKAIL